MPDYQALVDKVMTIVEADRGLIVLCDPNAGTCQYVATRNFTPPYRPYRDQMLIDLLATAQPALTDNLMAANYTSPDVVSALSLKHLLVVPLKIADALLVCDRPFIWGAFFEEDLANVVALVQQEGLDE